jgi:hypothetical protein
MPQDDRRELPESIQAQSGGLTVDQIGTVELLGALLDRAEEAAPSQVMVGFDCKNQPFIRAWFEPVVDRAED